MSALCGPRHHAGDAAVTCLIPALSCQSCRPNAPFAQLVRLSKARAGARRVTMELSVAR